MGIRRRNDLCLNRAESASLPAVLITDNGNSPAQRPELLGWVQHGPRLRCHAGGWRGHVPLLCEQCGVSGFGQTRLAFAYVSSVWSLVPEGRKTLAQDVSPG